MRYPNPVKTGVSHLIAIKRYSFPATVTVNFMVVNPSGKTVLSTTPLEAGRRFPLPSTGTPLIVRFIGKDIPADIYLPFNDR